MISLCYSADGTCVLAGGNSKFVCIYEISQRLLLKKFTVSHNQVRFTTLPDAHIHITSQVCVCVCVCVRAYIYIYLYIAISTAMIDLF
jgi:hypothetical protein